jgi:glycosyltransferase involved in cell wall biosynthesis
MKIIALLPVKNEEWCLKNCLDSLSFVDEIIAIDDNSTDSTMEILKEYKCTVIPFNTATQIGWKEFQIRTQLLEAAREHNATHIIALDADEACSLDFQKNARDILSKLKTGQSLEIEWVNLCSKDTFKKPIIFKSFAFCDDGVSTFKNAFLGVSRVPITTIAPLRIHENNFIFHFQYIDKKRCGYKQAWYMVSEFLKKEKSVKRINNMYSHTKNFTCEPIIPDSKKPLTIPMISDTDTIWQKDKILEQFEKYGIEYFETLDIWDLPELRQLFIEKVGKKPQPLLFPKWLVFLNNLKNDFKNNILK